MYVCKYVCKYVGMYVCKSVCVYVYVYVYVYVRVCVYVCMCVCVHGQSKNQWPLNTLPRNGPSMPNHPHPNGPFFIHIQNHPKMLKSPIRTTLW